MGTKKGQVRKTRKAGRRAYEPSYFRRYDDLLLWSWFRRGKK